MPLLACPAVSYDSALLGKPAVAPKIRSSFAEFQLQTTTFENCSSRAPTASTFAEIADPVGRAMPDGGRRPSYNWIVSQIIAW